MLLRDRKRPDLMRFNIHGLGFTVFLGGLSALPPLAIDMALPSLALVQADLGATQTQAASAIAIFLAGFATADDSSYFFTPCAFGAFSCA